MEFINYFFLIGNPYMINENKNISQNIEINQIKQFNPKIFSYYFLKESLNEFNIIKEKLENIPSFLIENIFPIKIDSFIDEINLNDLTDSNDIKYKIYENYIINEEEYLKEKKEYNFHSFYYFDPELFIPFYFNVLMFYEKIPKHENYYCAKVMILVTKKEICSLCKKILIKFYDEINSKQQSIETEIINIFQIFNYDIMNYNGMEIFFSENDVYKINFQDFFDNCDLEIKLFLKIFSKTDIFLLINHIISHKTLIISSNKYEILFPIYQILITLLFPFNNIDMIYNFKLMTPSHINNLIEVFSPTTNFCYSEKKLNKELISKITQKKNDDDLIYYYDINFNNNEFNIEKKIYKKKEDKIINVPFPKESLIEIIMKQNEDNNYIINIIYLEINELLNNYNLNNEIDFYKSSSDYLHLKEYFFSLILKYFNIIYDINKLYIKIIDNKFEFKGDSYNKKYKEQYDGLEDNQNIDIIIKKSDVKIDNNSLNNQRLNLIDELLKLSKFDESRLIFDFQHNIFENNKEKNDKIYKKKFDDLFDQFNNDNENYYEIQKKMNEINKEKPDLFIEKNNKLFFKFQGFKLNLKYYKYNINLNSKFNESTLNFENINENEKLIIMEFKNFIKLIYSGILEIKSDKEFIIIDIILFCSIILLYNLRSSNDYSENDYKYFENLLKNLLFIFSKEQQIFKKFSFLLSILYFIILQNEKFENEFKKKFIYDLKKFNILPTNSIFLLYNNNISFFDKINQTKKIVLIPILQNIKETNKSWHTHSFDFNGLNKEDNIYKCTKKGWNFIKCDNFLEYKIKLKDKKEEIILVQNPKNIFLNLIKKYIKIIFKYTNFEYKYEFFNNDLMNIISYVKCIYNIELFTN